jgi:hypothetical protein
MKIEFIKETKLDGCVMYYTKVNDSYVSNSLSTKESEARELFELIKKDHTALEAKKVVLESFEL